MVCQSLSLCMETDKKEDSTEGSEVINLALVDLSAHPMECHANVYNRHHSIKKLA